MERSFMLELKVLSLNYYLVPCDRCSCLRHGIYVFLASFKVYNHNCDCWEMFRLLSDYLIKPDLRSMDRYTNIHCQDHLLCEGSFRSSTRALGHSPSCLLLTYERQREYSWILSPKNNFFP